MASSRVSGFEPGWKMSASDFTITYSGRHILSPPSLLGYQALKDEHGSQRYSPDLNERQCQPVYKILQRPQEQSYLETSLNPLHQMNSGQLMYTAIMAHRPVPMPQGNIYPHHPHMGSQVFTEVSQGQISGGGTRPSTNPSSHSKQRPATPLEQSWEDNEFQFSSPAFLNFKFDPKPILACLPT